MTRAWALAVAATLCACAGEMAECERSSECEAPLVCMAGRCREECAEDRDCAAGLTCQVVAAGRRACVLPGMLACSATMPCDESLVCVEDVCRIRCTGAADCAPEESCVDGGGGMLACVPAAPP